MILERKIRVVKLRAASLAQTSVYLELTNFRSLIVWVHHAAGRSSKVWTQNFLPAKLRLTQRDFCSFKDFFERNSPSLCQQLLASTNSELEFLTEFQLRFLCERINLSINKRKNSDEIRAIRTLEVFSECLPLVVRAPLSRTSTLR